MAGRGIPFSAIRAACDNDAIMKQIYGLEHVHGVWYYNNNTRTTRTATAAFRRYNVASNTFIIAWTITVTITMNTTINYTLLIGMRISKPSP